MFFFFSLWCKVYQAVGYECCMVFCAIMSYVFTMCDGSHVCLLTYNPNPYYTLLLWLFLLSAAPISFKKKLENRETKEGEETTLSCETSSPDCKVTWRKGSTVLSQGEKYTIQQRATIHSLVIHKLVKEDSGEYTCDTGETKSSATLTVKGNCFFIDLPCSFYQKKNKHLTLGVTAGLGMLMKVLTSEGLSF